MWPALAKQETTPGPTSFSLNKNQQGRLFLSNTITQGILIKKPWNYKGLPWLSLHECTIWTLSGWMQRVGPILVMQYTVQVKGETSLPSDLFPVTPEQVTYVTQYIERYHVVKRLDFELWGCKVKMCQNMVPKSTLRFHIILESSILNL